jgi:hypothetical protein
MQLIEIVKEGLQAKGFGGLYVPGTCGCLIDDLAPASCLSCECEAGYKHTHSETGDWVVARSKEPLSDAEIADIAGGG